VTGVATIVLLSAAVLQTAYHAALLLWIWFGLPLVLAVAAAVRISAGRLRPAHRRRDTARTGISGTRATSGD
jgi:predicted signal transduction protein with EAL and GGDEF domain